MITPVTGNLLAADVDAVVNTVNTVGVMGKGIALQFKRAYPDMFKAYKKACDRGELQLGKMWVWHNSSFEGPRYVVNFPTKGHWRSNSKVADIDTGLADLVQVLTDLEISSIAIPPLGCGNGGLDWSVVRPIIENRLSELANVEVQLFEPAGAPAAKDMVDRTARPNMSVGKAALVTTVSRYTALALESSIVEVQKLMYFLQEAGQPLRLDYAKGRYGPYADNLNKVLSAVEGHFLTGFGDGSKRVADTEPIELLPGALDEASRVLIDDIATQQRIDRVLDLVSGFESAYFMELMATVHWVATRIDNEAIGPPTITRHVHEWSARKAGLFTEPHVASVLEQLRTTGFLQAA